ncbi:MAG: MATE family efflux transporter [Eubacteriales bacterium]|nr:MATE family efflux transporter [Eubacteriales bacterium]
MGNANPITTGVIWKQILIFFFPILVGAFFQQLYNAVDAAVVGQFAGEMALASVGGSSGQIVNLIFSFFMGLSTGATVIIAQYFGAKEYDKANTALHTAYAASVLGGLILGAVGVLISRPFLRLLSTPKELMPGSTLYVRILMAGLVFTLIFNIGSGILRAIGDSKRPLYILMMCCGLNIVLDLFFVVGLKLGVLGAALATVLCQALSSGVITYLLVKKTEFLTLRFSNLRIDPKTLGRILHIGLPTALAGSMFGISNMTVQTSVNALGVNTVAAWTAYSKIDALFWMVNQAFSMSTTTFIGQNYGARLPKRIRKATREVLAMEIGTSLCLSAFFLTCAPILLRLFASNPEVIQIGIRISRRMAPFYACFAVNEILGATLRAENYIVFSTITNLLTICVFRIFWVKFLFPGASILRITECYPISWALTSIVVLIYYMVMQPRILRRLQEA